MSEFLPDNEFERFRKLIYDQSGIHFSSSNRSILESRLKERIRHSDADTLDSYYSLILKKQDEMKVLLDSVTTNLTRFFRNTAHFQTFENYVIPELIKEKKNSPNKTVKLWSAGCSTGEEPYSLAMVLKEKLPPGIDFAVTASDLSLKSLMVGKEGFYGETRIGGVPDNYIKKYFENKNNGYQVKDEIKKKVKFDYHNLKFDSGQKNLDVIFCRNVLIYFDEPAQKAVINRFWDAMASHAYLFIGHSESLFGMETKFEFLKTNWACIYQKNA
ncbi:MAG: CheR family methyltransferase [Spirochaetia bacterium]